MVKMNTVKNFLKNIKHFLSKDSVICENLNFNNDKNWNNLKCYYFIIIILHSTLIEREL